MFTLNDHESTKSSYIDVFDQRDEHAHNCAKQLLDRLRMEFGPAVQRAYIDRMKINK